MRATGARIGLGDGVGLRMVTLEPSRRFSWATQPGYPLMVDGAAVAPLGASFRAGRIGGRSLSDDEAQAVSDHGGGGYDK